MELHSHGSAGYNKVIFDPEQHKSDKNGNSNFIVTGMSKYGYV